MIDLHMHTKYSDGTDNLVDILEKCQKINLEVISITDHNTCDAYFELEKLDIKKYYKGKIIVGCEFTTFYKDKLIEILGYGFDYKEVNKFLEQYYSEEQKKKNEIILYNKIIAKIKELNLIFNENNLREKKQKNEFIETIIYEELIKHPENMNILNDDSLSSLSNFFRKGLTNPKSKFFINRKNAVPKIQDIIDFIHSINGKLFLAHPYQYGFSDTNKIIEDLFNDYNLDGIECYYTTFSSLQTSYLIEFAKRKNLLTSGGSDYHGTAKINHDLGFGAGTLKIKADILTGANISLYNDYQ